MESQFDQIIRRYFGKHPISQKILLDQFPGLDFSHLESAYAIGHELFKQGKYSSAADIFYYLATMNHFEGRYWKALAVTLFLQKKYKDAMGVYLAAFFLNPDDIEVASAMGDCCISLGEKRGAIELFQQTCEIFSRIGKRKDLADRAAGVLDMLQQEKEDKNEIC